MSSSRDTSHREAINACLLLDTARAAKLTSRLPKGSQTRIDCEVLLAVAEAMCSFSPTADLVARVAARVEGRPRDAIAFEAMLIFGVHASALESRVGEGKRYLDLLRGVDGGSGWPAMSAQRLFAEGHLLWRLGELSSFFETAMRACEVRLPAGSLLGPRLRLAAIHAALSTSHLKVAARMIDELAADHSGDPYLDRVILLRRVRLMLLRGMGRRALRLLESAEEGGDDRFGQMVLNYRIRALLLCGRTDEALEIAREASAVLGESGIAFVSGKACLDRGDVEGAREHLRRAVLASPQAPPLLMLDVASYTAAAELVAGNARGAARLLDMVDRQRLDASLYGLRLWAALLERRDAEALGWFRRILDREDPDFTRESLRHLRGVSADQVARLWSAALDDPPAAGTASRSPAPRGVTGAHPQLIGSSPAVSRLRSSLRSLAALEETVLITGETGSGKELAARLLHDLGPRAAEPFLAVNCGALSDTLIESELFGHVKGAFTGAIESREGIFRAAGAGTVFLDEVSSMSGRLQTALLRVLETGEVRPVGSSRSVRTSARVVAASNQPLRDLVTQGAFRDDLYYRLERLRVDVPPLREHSEDIPELVRHFLGELCEHGDVALGDDLLADLSAHDWPGNVRELRNEVERVLLLSAGERVLHSGLSRLSRAAVRGAAAPAAAGQRTAPPPGRIRDRLGALRRLFRENREMTRAEAVAMLGCAPNTATKYLRSLCDEGLIERVMTSRSLRTSYFRLRD